MTDSTDGDRITFAPVATGEMLKRRAALLRKLRRYFDERDFCEVQTPVLMREAVLDEHVDLLWIDDRRSVVAANLEGPWVLQSSPEQAMKRLLASGAAKAIYQIGPVFRASEAGALHNPEFTMVEWYRVGDGLLEGVGLLDSLIQAVLKRPAADVLTYREAFLRWMQIDLTDPDAQTVEHLRETARRHAIHVASDFSDRPMEWLDLLFSHGVQPMLGQHRPTIVTHYPAAQAALARKTSDGLWAERFELFIEGVELANGYAELLDAKELWERSQEQAARKRARGRSVPPLPRRLLAAQRAGLPPCSGCALGFDRLLMVASGAPSIDRVLAFPIDQT
jgi:lysyl-tRNA synthetase class 2